MIAELFGGQGTINVNSWSPDGTRFAFVDYPLGDAADRGDPTMIRVPFHDGWTVGPKLGAFEALGGARRRRSR